MDKRGGKMKIVADGGYTHVVVGQKGVSCGALLSGGPVWSFDVAEGSQKWVPMLCIGRGRFAFASVLNLEWFGMSTG